MYSPAHDPSKVKLINVLLIHDIKLLFKLGGYYKRQIWTKLSEYFMIVVFWSPLLSDLVNNQVICHFDISMEKWF